MVPGCFQALPVPKCLSWKGKHTPGADGFLPRLTVILLLVRSILSLTLQCAQKFSQGTSTSLPSTPSSMGYRSNRFSTISTVTANSALVLLPQLIPSLCSGPSVSEALFQTGSPVHIDRTYLIRLLGRKTQEEDLSPQEANFP